MSAASELKELLNGTAEINPEDVHFDPRRDLIGGGAFGYVYRGLHHNTQHTIHKTKEAQKIKTSHTLPFDSTFFPSPS